MVMMSNGTDVVVQYWAAGDVTAAGDNDKEFY